MALAFGWVESRKHLPEPYEHGIFTEGGGARYQVLRKSKDGTTLINRHLVTPTPERDMAYPNRLLLFRTMSRRRRGRSG